MTSDSFKNCHPLVNIIYFLSILATSMFILHPIILLISLLGALSYSTSLTSFKSTLRFNLLFSLPGLLVILAINPLFNHFGVTQLLLLQNGNSITLESIIYGLILGIVLIVTINWFTAINQVLTRDKFIDVIGRILPVLALLLSISFRFIPLLIEQFHRTTATQNLLNQGIAQSRGFKKIKAALAITSALIGWALEKAIHISDSMQLRAYGKKRRTRYIPNHLDSRNIFLLVMILVLTTLVLIAKSSGHLLAAYNPIIEISGITTQISNPITYIGIASFLLLSMLPLLLKTFDHLIYLYQARKNRQLRNFIKEES